MQPSFMFGSKSRGRGKGKKSTPIILTPPSPQSLLTSAPSSSSSTCDKQSEIETPKGPLFPAVLPTICEGGDKDGKTHNAVAAGGATGDIFGIFHSENTVVPIIPPSLTIPIGAFEAGSTKTDLSDVGSLLDSYNQGIQGISSASSPGKTSLAKHQTSPLCVVTECPVCSKEYDGSTVTPVSLPAPCRHTTCRTCAEALFGKLYNDSRFVCPVCLSSIDPGATVKDLTVNKSVMELTYMVSQRKVEGSGGPRTCEECGKTSATLSCKRCETALCSACDKVIHSHKVLQNHTRTPFFSPFPVREPYFKTTKELCCYACSQFGDHKGHPVVARTGAEGRVHSTIQTELVAVKDKWSLLNQQAAVIQQSLSKLHISAAAAQRHISTEVQKIQAELDKREHALISELQERQNTISQPWIKEQEHVRLVEKEVSKLTSLGQQILDWNDEILLLGFSKFIVERLSSAAKYIPALSTSHAQGVKFPVSFPDTTELVSSIQKLGSITTTVTVSTVSESPTKSPATLPPPPATSKSNTTTNADDQQPKAQTTTAGPLDSPQPAVHKNPNPTTTPPATSQATTTASKLSPDHGVQSMIVVDNPEDPEGVLQTPYHKATSATTDKDDNTAPTTTS
ncbi:hypothetical protein Pelo_12528 [Pelomyxa schiedti]|nr:hypothetical protein Pelo_12528 [Pelomyxa schiedti]